MDAIIIFVTIVVGCLLWWIGDRLSDCADFLEKSSKAVDALFNNKEES